MRFSSALIERFARFLSHSPTSFHAVQQCIEIASDAGVPLWNERSSWQGDLPQRWMVVRSGTSWCGCSLPRTRVREFRICLAHTDSPGFKLKPRCEMRRERSVVFGVEVYGAPLLSSWLNRDLGIAGRVLVEQGGEMKILDVRLQDHPVFLPQLAIHLDRDCNEKGLLLNKQEHLHAVVGTTKIAPPEGSVLETLLRSQIDFERLLDHDLFLYPLEPPRLCGINSEFLSAYRIDNLASVYPALTAWLEAEEDDQGIARMVVFYDHEEVGSLSAQGAASPFFESLLQRIACSLGLSQEELCQIKARSVALSLDLAHAIHPSYPEKHDRAAPPYLGEGVVLKYNAQQRYATCLESLVPLYAAAQRAQVNLQKFVSRNDLPCGSTVGPIHASNTGIVTADLGIPQLSMHSAREVIAVADLESLRALLREFFR